MTARRFFVTIIFREKFAGITVAKLRFMLTAGILKKKKKFKNVFEIYLDKHLKRKHHGENVIRSAQKSSFFTVWWYIRPFHGQRDAV